MKTYKKNVDLCKIYLQLRNRLNKKTQNAKAVESIFSIYEKIEDSDLRTWYLKVMTTLCDKFDKHIQTLTDKQKNSFIMKYIEDFIKRWLAWNLPHDELVNTDEQKKLISLINSHIFNVIDTMFKVERKKTMDLS